jgi:hypothetical protein
VPWDAAATADRIFEVLADAKTQAELVALVRAAGAPLTWDRTAEIVLEVYEVTMQDRFREIAALNDGTAWRTEMASPSLYGKINGFDLPPDGYRALRALAARPRLGRAFFTTLGLAHRAGYFLKHRHGSAT